MATDEDFREFSPSTMSGCVGSASCSPETRPRPRNWPRTRWFGPGGVGGWCANPTTRRPTPARCWSTGTGRCCAVRWSKLATGTMTARMRGTATSTAMTRSCCGLRPVGCRCASRPCWCCATTRTSARPRSHGWWASRSARSRPWPAGGWPGFAADGGGKPFTHELWVRVDGKKYVNAPNNDLRAARVSDMAREWRQRASAMWPWCPPGKRDQLARVRPAVGLRFFPNPSAVPTDPDGLLAAIYQLVEDPDCSPIPGDNVQDRAFTMIDVLLQGVLLAEVRAALYRRWPRSPRSRSLKAPPTPPAAAAWDSRGPHPSRFAAPVTGSGWRSSWTTTPTATWAHAMW
jgi:hypothetical protein